MPKAPTAARGGKRGRRGDGGGKGGNRRGRSISPLESQQQQQQQQPGGLSHPEDLTNRAEQLAARARELRGGEAPGSPPARKEPDDFVTEELQHQKMQNMYLASISKQMERLAAEEVEAGVGLDGEAGEGGT